ncbi:stage II sporulation protein E [Microaerobacter geothermalis]|uniref:stage II sporulation protein E n=1 Tax=Microaerobacter geothermalis TaxID=674972 RepID=UPI001F24CA2F|nr:stage II sporulation protein E [Microaerobacter geothermalis]MCF6094687.1 stage II sporulation protein E [Microaerobacter geothermalis]
MLRKENQIISQPFSGTEKWVQGVSWIQSKGMKLYEKIFIQWQILSLVIAFLLGRAIILSEIAPFSVPYVAVMVYLRRSKMPLLIFALLLGSGTQSLPLFWGTMISVGFYLILQQMMYKKKRIPVQDISALPVMVFFSVFISGAAVDFIYNQLTGYAWLMNSVESILSMVLTLIFIQALPIIVLEKHHHHLKQEEIVCLMIFLASVLTGTVGWMVNGYSVEHILSRFLILIFAYVGGGAIGAAVGVVIGLILSLADVNFIDQIGLLAFSGLLAGLLKEGKKWGVAIGFIVGSAILTIYAGDKQNLWISTVETFVSVFFFFLIPPFVFKNISRYIPGTPEHLYSQQEYVTKLRDATATKVQMFSDLFKRLSKSFNHQIFQGKEGKERHYDFFLSIVTETTCNRCFKKERCWNKEFDHTYGLMKDMIGLLERGRLISLSDVPEPFLNKCIKSSQFIQQMKSEYETYQHQLILKKQVGEARRIVADQLLGISKVMNDFSQEIQRESQELNVQEQQIMDRLEELGLTIRNVEIINLEQGNVDIEISQPTCYGRDECEKIVAPLLSDILQENITVLKKECHAFTDGYCTMCLGSAKAYQVETGAASVAKGGGWLSGDCFSMTDLGNGKYVLAISDGMGNGERAYKESSETLELLQQILRSGIDETLAIKSVNSILSLRTNDEIFATLDLAIIDLHSANARFMKVGSTPSFIMRGDQVLHVTANNLPIGILHEIDVDVVSIQLKPGDLLIMVSDGIYDAERVTQNKEAWIKRLISEIKTLDPQEVADILLEKVVRYHQGDILDDMTVLVAKIDPYIPEWATISIPGNNPIERPKSVV